MSGTTENQMRAYAETGAKTLYPASPIKRHRATAAEMEERAQFLIAYARHSLQLGGRVGSGQAAENWRGRERS